MGEPTHTPRDGRSRDGTLRQLQPGCDKEGSRNGHACMQAALLSLPRALRREWAAQNPAFLWESELEELLWALSSPGRKGADIPLSPLRGV